MYRYIQIISNEKVQKNHRMLLAAQTTNMIAASFFGVNSIVMLGSFALTGVGWGRNDCYIIKIRSDCNNASQ